MTKFIHNHTSHPAWPEVGAFARKMLDIPDLTKITEVELYGVMWAWAASRSTLAEFKLASLVNDELDRIMFVNSGGN